MKLRRLFMFWKKNPNKKDELKSMSDVDKKEFLSNDLIDRMIRVEQQVSSSLGHKKIYNKTEYYKSLQPDEKKRYTRFLKNKQQKKKWFLLVIFFSFILISVLNINFTGNVVNNAIGEENFYIVSNFLLFFILICLFLGLIIFIYKKRNHRRIKKGIKIIDKIMLKREVEKYFGKDNN